MEASSERAHGAASRSPAIESSAPMAHVFCSPMAARMLTVAAALVSGASLAQPVIEVPGAAAASASDATAAQAPKSPNTEPTNTQLAPITIRGRLPATANVAGFGGVPLSQAPFQASVIGSETMKDAGVRRLSDITRLDPALSDAYDSAGYVDYLTVRGFVIDNRFSFQRDGLPINAETSIPLENKSRVEVLKGTSGIQAGTSAPGGLVNLVVKRPLDAPLRSASLEWQQAGSVLGAVDISQRFGFGDVFGVRVNAAAEHIDPLIRDLRGHREMFALAGDWRLGRDSVIEAEVEHSHRSQPSQPGFSMLGDQVPPPNDPRINLNNQPWSLPVVFDATTASVRWSQRLNADWRLVAHGAMQRLRTDDRVAFPFGCTDAGPNGTYYSDRYCPNGRFDLYDFRSENERRRLDVIDVHADGHVATGPFAHALTVGGMRSSVRIRTQMQANNLVDQQGLVDGTAVTSPAPDPSLPGTNRDERSSELYLRDAIKLDLRTTAWLGMRHTRIDRGTVRTDGTEPSAYRQSFNTPWLAVSYALTPQQLVYASFGEGVESEVAPEQPRFINHGQALPALKSRQSEVGLKGASGVFDWSVAAFDIRRPLFSDVGACDVDPLQVSTSPPSCTHQLDGVAHHRGVEVNGSAQWQAWTVNAGMQRLHARREGDVDATLDGRTPTNVPATTLKLQADYRVPTVAGLALQGGLVHESSRFVLPDDSARIPGWSRVDAGAKFDVATSMARWTWRVGVDNVFDKRAWKESPYQFSHAYLFPLAPRTWRASVQVDL